MLRSHGSSRLGLNSYFTPPLPNRIVPTQTALNFAAQRRCVWGRISFEVSPLFCPRLRLLLPSQDCTPLGCDSCYLHKIVPRPNQNPGLSKTNVQQRTFFNFKGNRERSCKVFQFIPGIEVILLLLEVLTIKVIPMRQERRIISLFCLH